MKLETNFTLNGSLYQLNEEEAKQYIGGVIFVAVVMFLGIVGNLHVVLVYTFRIKPSNHRIFILVLGVLDFTTCAVGMPFIIVDLRNPLTFMMSRACKLLRFINYFICSSSSLILLVIATERYRKICVPHGRQISQRVAKLLCCLVLIVAVFMSWPAPVLFGTTTVRTSNPSVNGSRCDTENRENFQKYQAFFNAGLILVVIVSFCVLAVLYTLIWRNIVQNTCLRDEESGRSSGPRPREIYSVELSQGSADTTEKNEFHESNQKTSFGEGKSVSCSDLVQETFNTRGDKFDRKKKTTVMFLLITSVYFISYFPHLVLKIVTHMNKDFLHDLSFEEKLVYNMFIWCFFINNMANCFIYGCFDVRFRQEINRMYRRIFCCN